MKISNISVLTCAIVSTLFLCVECSHLTNTVSDARTIAKVPFSNPVPSQQVSSQQGIQSRSQSDRPSKLQNNAGIPISNPGELLVNIALEQASKSSISKPEERLLNDLGLTHSTSDSHNLDGSLKHGPFEHDEVETPNEPFKHNDDENTDATKVISDVVGEDETRTTDKQHTGMNTDQSLTDETEQVIHSQEDIHNDIIPELSESEHGNILPTTVVETARNADHNNIPDQELSNNEEVEHSLEDTDGHNSGIVSTTENSSASHSEAAMNQHADIQTDDTQDTPIATLESPHPNDAPNTHKILVAATNLEGSETQTANMEVDTEEKENIEGSNNHSVVPLSSDETTSEPNGNVSGSANVSHNASVEDNGEEDSEVSVTTTYAPEVERIPEDVNPLNIFVDDITYQRFPKAMSLTVLKQKIIGKKLKKIYILEETEKKIFSHVRQLEVIYTLEENMLYANFLFRFVFSRKCQEIPRFKIGKLAGNKDEALFEKELPDGRTERIVFFSERPDEYIYFMSCTDMKVSPYACRDTYYVTLDSSRDPPNQFPWIVASTELSLKMNMTFEDPRFIFNLVLMPCART